MGTVTTATGVDLYYKEWGAGRPVVLVHGWPMSADSWDPVSEALAQDGYRVIAYDRRGFGRSEQPFSGYDYDTFSDDLADVMQATEISEDAAIIGFSMGGGEVARYMSRHGGRGVSRTALISSVVPYMVQADDNPDGVPPQVFDSMVAGLRRDRPDFLRSFFQDFFGNDSTSEPAGKGALDWAWSMSMQAGLHPTIRCVHAFAETDFRRDLKHFNVPTLVVHGTIDEVVPIDISARVAAREIPDARLVEYDDEPHGLFATSTNRLICDLKALLSLPGQENSTKHLPEFCSSPLEPA